MTKVPPAGMLNTLSAVGVPTFEELNAAGRGVPQDDVEGYMWLSLAAARLDPKAEADRDAVAARMTPDQIMLAEEFVREWKPAPPP